MHKIDIDPWFIEKAKRTRGGRLNAYERLDGRKTALVVVDMQDYFVADGMPSCAPEARTVVPNINRLAQATRASGGIVVWIQTDSPASDPDDWANRKEATSPENWQKRRTLLARGGAGFGIYSTCGVLPEDKIAEHRQRASLGLLREPVRYLANAHGKSRDSAAAQNRQQQ